MHHQRNISSVSRTIDKYRHLFHASIFLFAIFPWPLLGLAEGKLTDYLGGYWLTMAISTIPFYFINSYLLVPRYLTERKYTCYIACIMVCVLFSAILHALFYNVTTLPDSIVPQRSIFRVPFYIFPMLLLFGLSTSFELVRSSEMKMLKEEGIEKEKMVAELSFLKYQINPHFLFNSLNNIFSLAEKKSNQTGAAVMLLSNIMRYVLYETNHGKIPLLKEIRHAEDYIAMHRLRISDQGDISIHFVYDGDLQRAEIEPLILIPFIENAFKHGISYSKPSTIDITLVVTGHSLVFNVVNTKRAGTEQRTAASQHCGIGIANTKRRLDLIYSNRYELDIDDSKDYYMVELKIDLSHKGGAYEN
jgi:two-component system, LytTR family, sensor kinase